MKSIQSIIEEIFKEQWLTPLEEKPKCEYCENGEEHKAGAIYPCTPHEEKGCKHCKMDIAIRNPSGFCDHLYYPENCKVCHTKDLIE